MKLFKSLKLFFVLCVVSLLLQVLYYNTTAKTQSNLLIIITILTFALLGYILGWSSANILFYVKKRGRK